MISEQREGDRLSLCIDYGLIPYDLIDVIRWGDGTIINQAEHFERLRRWLAMESEAERLRMTERRRRQGGGDVEKSGETLIDLVISDRKVGVGGRYIIRFAKRSVGRPLPWNRMRLGSPVMVSDDSGEGGFLSGVVCARTQATIDVSIDQWPEGEIFRIDLSSDEVTRQRQMTAMRVVEQSRGRVAALRDILLLDREAAFLESKPIEFASHLNKSQCEAVQFALSSRDLAIIHGPPGTGKTTTVVEIIRQAVMRGEKVLACAPSNAGVDNLLERLVPLGISVVRVGHPARVHETLQSHTLDALIENDEMMDLVKDYMREAERLTKQSNRYTRAKPHPGYRQQLREEIRDLREAARRLERQVSDGILDGAEVVCATTTYDPAVLGDRLFDLAVVDEACQSTEPGIWPVVLRANRIILAGDHCQLPPTVLSTEAATEGFAVSMMERLVRDLGHSVTRQLTVQYRMHCDIMGFSSNEFYANSLVADASVANHVLKDIVGMMPSELTATPLLFIDSAGANWDEQLEPDGESKLNPEEGRLLLKLLEELIETGLNPRDIAVIAPYAAQVRWLRDHYRGAKVEIDTVDGFQGREKEAVLISMVRSNAEAEIGFLGDQRRMNVAMTRARRKLIVIGDSTTLGNHAFFARMLEYFEKHSSYRSVWEFMS
jgi:ATP-dependent RNA/DNA helicase IGHMBP2